jgi:hypothetical protein
MIASSPSSVCSVMPFLYMYNDEIGVEFALEAVQQPAGTRIRVEGPLGEEADDSA